jgi:hypothetical protein
VNVEEGSAVIANSNSPELPRHFRFSLHVRKEMVFVHSGFCLMYIVTTVVYPLIFRDIVRELEDR